MSPVLRYNDVLDELRDYILDDVNIEKCLKPKIADINIKNDKLIKYNNINKNADIYIPKEHDSLFWCYYIIANGSNCYELLNNKNSLITKQLKINLVSAIRKNKSIVKSYKLDSIANIESNLANDNYLNIKTFLVLCVISNINIIYVNKKTYFELLMNDSNEINIIYNLEKEKKYGFENSSVKIANIRESLYKVDSIDKYIKSITFYKVEELINICCKLSIETNNKETGKAKSKKDLYEQIIQYF